MRRLLSEHEGDPFRVKTIVGHRFRGFPSVTHGYSRAALSGRKEERFRIPMILREGSRWG